MKIKSLVSLMLTALFVVSFYSMAALATEDIKSIAMTNFYLFPVITINPDTPMRNNEPF